MREEFERVSPESVGVSSRAILEYLDALEASGTQMHGLMILRHGKLLAEGWWAPYGPRLRHGLQSHSKTYAATAVGILYTEGKVRLDERIIDIFPECAPENPSENLKLLTVRDVLCMGCGMETEPRPATEHWIRDFLHTPVVHKPGTAYMYNSTGSSLLCAIVKRKTGEGVEEYLTKRLYEPCGMDPQVHRWYPMPDGVEGGGFGMMSTLEDNLRLLKLYADGGVCNGRRILAEDYVRLATSNQNDSATEAIGNPEATDNHVGYGFQIWMCKPKGVYRADGAMGQFTIVCPDQDMIIAITETAEGAHWAQSTLDITWAFLAKVTGDQVLPEGPETAYLARRMRTLCTPQLPCRPRHGVPASALTAFYRVTEGYFTPYFYNPMLNKPEGLAGFTFAEDDYGLIWKVRYESGRTEEIRLTTYGSWHTQVLGRPEDYVRLCAAGAWWQDATTLAVELKWVETCFTKRIWFAFQPEGLEVTEEKMRGVVSKILDQVIRVEREV